MNGYDIADIDTSTVQAYVGGIEQTVVSVSPTSVVIQIDDVTTGLSAQTLEVYFEVGAPNGLPLIYEGVALGQALLGLEVSEGSECGSKITARVSGLGVDDSSVVTLVNAADNQSICASQEISAYGVLECVTKAEVIGSPITIALDVDGSTVTCNGFGGNSCTYQTFGAGQPSISSPAISTPTTLSFTGSNLALAGATGCSLSFAGVEADSCDLGSSSATWATGVPLPIVDEAPVLTIMTDNAGIMASHEACSSDTVGIVFDYPSATQTAVPCSYPGGCLQTIDADGLATNVHAGNMKVEVCGVEASLRADLSSSSQAVF